MKAIALLLLFSAPMFIGPSLAADGEATQDQLNGTWSGSWISPGGVHDAMTIQLRHDESGKLTGRFVTPVPLDFTKTTFNPKTRTIFVEAADAKSGKQHRLSGTVDGTEIRGTFTGDNQSGQVRLIKWTYVPPIKPY